MKNLIAQMDVLAAGIEVTIWVAGIMMALVGLKVLIDLLKGDN